MVWGLGFGGAGFRGLGFLCEELVCSKLKAVKNYKVTVLLVLGSE